MWTPGTAAARTGGSSTAPSPWGRPSSPARSRRLLFCADPVHTGEVYLNGKAMYESTTLEGVLAPQVYRASWDPDFTLHKWYVAQDGDFTVFYANFQGADPNAENVEINVRRSCFYPSQEGVGYITLSGFIIRQAATQWAPPTAYQEGMVGPHWSKGGSMDGSMRTAKSPIPGAAASLWANISSRRMKTSGPPSA